MKGRVAIIVLSINLRSRVRQCRDDTSTVTVCGSHVKGRATSVIAGMDIRSCLNELLDHPRIAIFRGGIIMKGCIASLFVSQVDIHACLYKIPQSLRR